MIRNNDVIHGYAVLAIANGIALAHSKTAPDPYVVWHITEDGSDVYGGKYQSNKEDAEWDFCCKAFPWFEDNASVNMIEDEAAERIEEFQKYLGKAQSAIDSAATLVENMVAEHEKLVSKKEAPQEESTELIKVESSNSDWTEIPRLAIDEHGISLSGVYLPDITRFSLKDSGNLDGLFILDLEVEVGLA